MTGSSGPSSSGFAASAIAYADATARCAVAFVGGSINAANSGTSRNLNFANAEIGAM